MINKCIIAIAMISYSSTLLLADAQPQHQATPSQAAIIMQTYQKIQALYAKAQKDMPLLQQDAQKNPNQPYQKYNPNGSNLYINATGEVAAMNAYLHSLQEQLAALEPKLHAALTQSSQTAPTQNKH